MLSRQPADVCIVGSGVAGALTAARCAERGMRVILIEAGHRFDRRRRTEQLRGHEVLGWPLWPWSHAARDTFEDASRDELGFTYTLNDSRIKAVGGSTLHWGGMINRFWESDFETYTRWGLGTDWPIGYQDLEPYYGQAEKELGVSGTVNPSDPPRSTPYPMEGFPPRYAESAWFDVAEKMGIQLEHVSHARNSRPYGGRPACAAFAVCSVCPISARYSADFHVDRAIASGRVDLLTETVARRVDVGPDGKVRAVHATTLDGEDVEVTADRYVVAAHAIESARLLLLSDVGNHSDQVGRNLMEHWYVAAGGTVDQPVYPGRIGFATIETSHWYEGEERRDRGGIKMEFMDRGDTLNQLLSRGLSGRELADEDCDRFGHWVGIGAEVEHLPNPDSRVTLSSEVRDGFGDPAPRIRFAISETDRRTHEVALKNIQTLLEARGCRDIETAGEWERAHHHMGTCRMSAAPEDGVVDADCRVHGTRNLYMAGSSVFPTGAARQPTLTIAALALRLADHLHTIGTQ